MAATNEATRRMRNLLYSCLSPAATVAALAAQFFVGSELWINVQIVQILMTDVSDVLHFHYYLYRTDNATQILLPTLYINAFTSSSR